MGLAAEIQRLPLTEEWLTSRTFTFVAQPKGSVISESFVLHPNGFIVGYNHPNESFWDTDGDALLIQDHHGQTTCRLELEFDPAGTPFLAGNFISPWQNYEITDTRHELRENGSDYHARIQSFDLFDTLVARRCFAPLEVFRRVEEKSGVANFATRRHLVEMSMFGRVPYGLDEIYGLLVQEGLLSESQATMVRLMELEEEWDMLFPMSQVVAFVNPDDIIISDMYLPYDFVERIVREKCGLKNKIYLSNYGKHHRTIWPKIIEEYRLRAHFGDNPHADVKGAQEFGITPNFVTLSKWNRSEEILHGAGLGGYAHAVREMRLKTFHRDVHVRNALQAQATINIPLMIIGAFWLRHCAAAFGADRMLAAARDCNLFTDLLATPHFVRLGLPPVEYVRISRTLCYSGSEAFEAYVRSRLGQRTLLVDMVGTGRSLKTFVERSGMRDIVRPCILVADDAVVEADAVESLIRKNYFECRVYLEALNASLDGSAVAARVEGHRVVIEEQPNEFGEPMRAIIGEMRTAFRDFLPLLDRFAPPTGAPPLETLRAAADALVQMLPPQAMKLEILLDEQLKHMRRGVAPA